MGWSFLWVGVWRYVFHDFDGQFGLGGGILCATDGWR